MFEKKCFMSHSGVDLFILFIQHTHSFPFGLFIHHSLVVTVVKNTFEKRNIKYKVLQEIW